MLNQLDKFLRITCSKLGNFVYYYILLLSFSPSPAGMSLTKISLGGKILIIPGQGEFG